jgi:sulfoxide reductase heme-binding subunit YedZ
VSLLVLVVLVAHIVTSVLDSFAPIKVADAVLPFGASYRPLWLGLGALSFDILVALVVTSLVRRRLGYKAWRAIHWLAYASWPVAVLHGLGTGTDTKIWWNLAITVACLAAVVIAVWIRIARAPDGADRLRGPAIALTLATPIALVIFTLAGPLQRGWARKAGTPATLLGKTSRLVSTGGAGQAGSTRRGAALSSPFSARLTGTVTQTPEPGGAIVDLALRLSGGLQGRLRVRLGGAPLNGGGLSMTGSQVDLIAAGVPAVLEGQVVSLQGQQFLARVANTSGSVVDLRANLNIDSQTGAVSGTLAGTPVGSGG